MEDSQQFKGSRLNSSLGQNELREYLAHKEETAIGKIEQRVPQFMSYGKGLDRKPRVLLIAPRITIPHGMLKRVIPPLGLSYIAASLLAVGYEVKIIDCTIEGYDQEERRGNLMTYGKSPREIVTEIQEFNPDVVGVSVLFSTDLLNLFETCKVVKEAVPQCTVVVGGLHATIYPREIFELDEKLNSLRTIDFVIRGEGELRLIEFLKNLAEGRVDVQGDGLVGFAKGGYFQNHQIETISDINILPFPAYHLLPMEKYFEINVPFSPVPMGDRVAQLLTSRGCPISCSFCSSTNMYKKYRVRSVDNIIREIAHLKATYQIDEIQFADDNLTLDRDHSVKFFQELSHMELKWCTPNGTMVNTLSADLLDLMARSGLYQITLSLDSGNLKTLKNLHHKPVDLSRIPVLIEKAQEYGIFTHGTLVVGMPGESIEDIKEGFDFVLNGLDLTSISTFIAAAIPGSELYHQALDKGLIKREEAYLIDTTRSKIQLSNIDSDYLEGLVMDFQKRFTEKARQRDPGMYQRKYAKLIARGRMPLIESHGGRLT